MATRRHRFGAALAACLTEAALTSAPATAAPATGQIRLAGTATAIPGSYIVVLKPGRSTPGQVTGTVRRTFGATLHGFEAALTEAAAKRLAADPAVAYVEQNQVVSLADTQPGATWGLDRVDQADLPLNGTYTFDRTAPEVTAYLIDTGILVGHREFGGRASIGFDALGGTGSDCNGHGTHVAGTVGGTTYGVAKDVALVAVRVLNCSGAGTTAGVIAGVDWVTARTARPAVANMSLGGTASAALDSAVAASIASGVTYALAAGNSAANACNSSPARVPAALTVGATTSTDARAYYSNYGSCLDLFAPGSAITSAWVGSTTATNTISGTSMASPHVAGAAALVLAATPSATPAQVRDTLVARATAGKVTSPGTGSPNRLLRTS